MKVDNRKVIKFKIVTPEKTVFEDEVYQVTLPINVGDVTILPDHIPYIASLKPGEVVIKKEKNASEATELAVAGGFVEFNNNNLIVLADSAERVEDINVEEIEKAKKRAEELKHQRIIMDENEYAKVLAEFEKGMAWSKIAQKYASRRK